MLMLVSNQVFGIAGTGCRMNIVHVEDNVFTYAVYLENTGVRAGSFRTLTLEQLGEKFNDGSLTFVS